MSGAVVSLIYVLVFVAVVFTVQGVAGILFQSRDRAERTNRRLTMLASGMTKSDVYDALVRRPDAGSGTNAFVVGLYGRFANHCRQAGFTASPLLMLAYAGAAGIMLWLTSFFLFWPGNFSTFLLSAIVGLPASLVFCGLMLWAHVDRSRTKRLKQLEEQMPLALDVINRAIRAGHPVVAAVRLAGEEMGDPIGSEFGLIVDETTYGYEFREALMNFARRTGSSDAHFFAVGVAIQSDTGGNLVEILEGLATVIRSRATLSKKVKALSSEGRASAWLLSALPILLVSFMTSINAGYYTSKFSDPIFWPTVTGVCVLYCVGLVFIRRLLNFKY